MHKIRFYKGLTRILTDFLSGFLAWNLSYWIRPWTDLIPNIQFVFPLENLPNPEFFLTFSLVSSFGFIVILATQNCYSYPEKYLNFSVLPRLLWGVIFWGLSIIAVYSLFFHEQIFSRIMLAHALIFTLIFSVFFRGILRVLFEKIWKSKKSALLLGEGAKTALLNISLQNSEYTEISEVLFPDVSDKILKNYDEIFCFDVPSFSLDIQKLKSDALSLGKVFHLLPENSLDNWGHSYFDFIRGYAVITTLPHKEKIWWSALKRAIDIVFSLFFLIVFSPVFLVIAFLSKKDAKDWKAPVFYVSERVGKNGKLFKMWKFRSMQLDADKKKKDLESLSHREGPLFKIKNDPRITPFGKFLRKTSLDEIPQFINVLMGTMSVIGPRPHLEKEVNQYTKLQKRVLIAKPGISGLAQISGRSDLSFDEEVQLDLYYIENSSFLLDFKIFIKTPFVLLFGGGND